MNKKGFVLVESIVVLMVVALSLTMLISSYSLVSRKTKEKEHYDKASDKYLLYAISKLGTDDLCNYSVSCTSKTDIKLRADVDNTDYKCNGTKVGEIMYDCESVFREMNIKHLYVVENILNDLNDLYNDGSPKARAEIKANEFYDNGTIEYLKTLKKCNDVEGVSGYSTKTTCADPITYMVGVFERGNGDYYYASITIPKGSTTTVSSPSRNGWALTNDTELDANHQPYKNQKWSYYLNNEPVTGLHYMKSGNGTTNITAHYYFDSSGIMKTGFINVDGKLNYFLSIDKEPNNQLDGHRVGNCIITMDGVEYTFDVDGTCISDTCASASGIPNSVEWATRRKYIDDPDLPKCIN